MMGGPFKISVDLIKGTNVWYSKRAPILVSFTSIILKDGAKAFCRGAAFAKASSFGARNVLFGHLSTDSTMPGWRSK
jgi:hypothetical protein